LSSSGAWQDSANWSPQSQQVLIGFLHWNFWRRCGQEMPGISRNQVLGDLDEAFLRLFDCQAIRQMAVEDLPKRKFSIINRTGM